MWDTLIIGPFTNALLFIYNVTGNFGVAIILFTFIIRLITHPLMVQQMKGTRGMQTLQNNPKYKEIQEKYKNDREKLAQEQMALYKELGINPFMSCLPMLVQFPIIIGLYQAIIQVMASSPLDMLRTVRLAYPWLVDVTTLLPLNNTFLWMDLGQPERLNLPFLPFGIPILAIVVVVTTYLQSKLMTPPTAGNSQAAQMTGMMNLYMPLFMGYLALTFASGLSLYFVASNLVGIFQSIMLGNIDFKTFTWRSLLPSLNFSGAAGSTAGSARSSQSKSPSSSSSSSSSQSKSKSRSEKAKYAPRKPQANRGKK
jgi:YidC/Oxa1 family membrane protein insertase